jgi:hypothetical protein
MKQPRFNAVALVFLVLTLGSTLRSEASGKHEVVVTNHVTIRLEQKLNPKFWFGNLDEPVPPDDYRPDDKRRVSKWYWRNPTHNLTFYVIGLTDKTFRRWGKYPDRISGPRGGWNFAVCQYKLLRLPFVSYKKKSFSFYLGWRERGNFGGKLSFRDKP